MAQHTIREVVHGGCRTQAARGTDERANLRLCLASSFPLFLLDAVGYLSVSVHTSSSCYLIVSQWYTWQSNAFRLRMLPDADNYVLLAEDF